MDSAESASAPSSPSVVALYCSAFTLSRAVRGAGGVDVALDIGGFHLLRVRVDAEALQQHRPGHGKHQAHHDGGGDGHGRHLPRLERFGGACRDWVPGTFQRMGFHNPHAEYHAKDGGDGGHDERDGDGGVDRGVGGAGDAAAFLRSGERTRQEPDCAAQANMLSISQMPICRRARLVMWNRPRPFTGMVMRMPPISTWVTMEKMMPASSSSDDSGHDAVSVRAARTRRSRCQMPNCGSLVPKLCAVEHEQDLGPVRVELGAEHQSDDQGNRPRRRVEHSWSSRSCRFRWCRRSRGWWSRPQRRGAPISPAMAEMKPTAAISSAYASPQADPGAQLRPNHALEAELRCTT